MPTQSQKIPNKPLDGEEVGKLIVVETDELIAQLAAGVRIALDREIDRNTLFRATYGHPRIKIEITARMHWSNMNLPKTEIAVALSTNDEPNVDDPFQLATGIKREIEIENPNLTRAYRGFPITVTDVKRPGPNEQFGTIEHHEISINASDYPEPNPPKDTDISDSVADQLKIPKDRRIGVRK